MRAGAQGSSALTGASGFSTRQVVEVVPVEPAWGDRVGDVPFPQVIKLEAGFGDKAAQVDVPGLDELATVLGGQAIGESPGRPAPHADPAAGLTEPYLHPAAGEPVGGGWCFRPRSPPSRPPGAGT